MTNQKSKLFIFATIKTKPVHFDEAKKALEDLVPLSLAEPGCHIFSPFANKTNANTLHLFECFEDEDALIRHYDEPYTIAVFKQYEDWLTGPVEIEKLQAISELTNRQFIQMETDSHAVQADFNNN